MVVKIGSVLPGLAGVWWSVNPNGYGQQQGMLTRNALNPVPTFDLDNINYNPLSNSIDLTNLPAISTGQYSYQLRGGNTDPISFVAQSGFWPTGGAKTINLASQTKSNYYLDVYYERTPTDKTLMVTKFMDFGVNNQAYFDPAKVDFIPNDGMNSSILRFNDGAVPDLAKIYVYSKSGNYLSLLNGDDVTETADTSGYAGKTKDPGPVDYSVNYLDYSNPLADWRIRDSLVIRVDNLGSTVWYGTKDASLLNYSTTGNGLNLAPINNADTNYPINIKMLSLSVAAPPTVQDSFLSLRPQDLGYVSKLVVGGNTSFLKIAENATFHGTDLRFTSGVFDSGAGANIHNSASVTSIDITAASVYNQPSSTLTATYPVTYDIISGLNFNQILLDGQMPVAITSVISPTYQPDPVNTFTIAGLAHGYALIQHPISGYKIRPIYSINTVINLVGDNETDGGGFVHSANDTHYRYRIYTASFVDVTPGDDYIIVKPNSSLNLVSSSTFTPGQGSIEILGFMGAPSVPTANINIYDSMSNVINSWTDSNLQAGNHSFIWDGKNSSLVNVPAGNYTVGITLTGERPAASLTEQLFPVTVFYPVAGPAADSLFWLTKSNLVIGEGDLDINLQVGAAGVNEATVEVLNYANKKIRELSKKTNLVAGNEVFYWDGYDDNNNPVAPGSYKLSCKTLGVNAPASTTKDFYVAVSTKKDQKKFWNCGAVLALKDHPGKEKLLYAGRKFRGAFMLNGVCNPDTETNHYYYVTESLTRWHYKNTFDLYQRYVNTPLKKKLTEKAVAWVFEASDKANAIADFFVQEPKPVLSVNMVHCVLHSPNNKKTVKRSALIDN